MRTWIFLVVGVFGLGVQQAQVIQGINLYNRTDEVALSTALAERVKRHTEIFDDIAVSAYIARIGNNLSTGLPNITWKPEFVLTLTDLRGRAHEPLALPTGQIYVPVDLILAVQSEDELVGMLAHAIAHVAEHHMTRLATHAKLLGLDPLPLVTAIALGEAGDGSKRVSVGFVGIQRRFEIEADRLASQLTANAGYSADALGQYLGRVDVRKTGLMGGIFSSMPDKAVRIASIRSTLPANRRTLPDQTQLLHDLQKQISDRITER
jgi:predicted Zn-dependent protease